MENFNRIDFQVAAALHRMQSPEMKPLLDHLRGIFERSKTSLIHADKDRFLRQQGEAGFLEEYLAAIETAATTMDKLK